MTGGPLLPPLASQAVEGQAAPAPVSLGAAAGPAAAPPLASAGVAGQAAAPPAAEVAPPPTLPSAQLLGDELLKGQCSASPLEKQLAAQSPLRFDSLGDSVLIFLGLAGVQRMVGFVRAVFFCRWLDAEQLGRWDMAFAFLMLAAPLSVISLSGCFGRYVEHYRQRGQLRALIRRVAGASALLGLLAASVIALGREWFSRLVFGSDAQAGLMALLAACLPVIIATHFFYDLLNGLRNARLLAALQMCNGVLFTALALTLLGTWQSTAGVVVATYGLACLACALAALGWTRRMWRQVPPDGPPPQQRAFWKRILPYVGWMVLVSLLVNLFQIADRYMIVHFSGLAPPAALACVGQYHASRVVPMLLLTITLSLAALITPHLSHDWENGQRARVSQRLGLFLKLWGFILVLAGLCVLLAAPLLFGVAFRGKFVDGQAVLPWTMTYCTWAALAGVVHSYLLCAEKAGRSVLATGIGLAVNVVLNLLLLPRLGLLGAVLATTAANLVVLVLICVFCRQLGMRFDRGALLVLALPVVLGLGPWVALAVLAAVTAASTRFEVLLSAAEKRHLATSWSDYRHRVRACLGAS